MKVAEFIASCRRFSDGNFSVPVCQTLNVGVEVMTEYYAMSLPASRSAVAGENGELGRHRRGQWHELVQHLTDLAYLTPDKFAEWHALRSEGEPASASLYRVVTAAVGTFISEDDYPNYALLPPYPDSPVDRQAWVAQYISVVVYRLASYTSFDGDLLPRPDYTVGAQTAYGRSLAFRLRVYFFDYGGGRRSGRRQAYFGRDQFKYLYSLDNSLGGRYREWLPDREATLLHVRVQELLLSSQLLFGVYREVNRFTPDAGRPYYLRYDLKDSVRAPTTRRDRRLQRRTDRKIKREEQLIDTGGNRLGVRLLQIGLWRAGFYTGVLDGTFGVRSHAAVRLLLQQERTIIADKRQGVKTADPALNSAQLRRVVIRSSEDAGGSYAVDLRLMGRLLDAYAPPPEPIARREEEAIWEQIESSGQSHLLDETLVSREPRLSEAYGRQQQHPHRRVYYGLRGLIRGAFRAVGRVLRWIGGLVKRILGAVFDFVKAVVKRIQEGAGLFFTGMAGFVHFVLGRPFVSFGDTVSGRRPVMATHYRVDFDVVSVVDRTVSGDDLRQHQLYLQHTLQGMSSLMEVTTSVIDLVSRLQPPLSWLRLGTLIGRRVRDWLTDEPSMRPVA